MSQGLTGYGAYDPDDEGRDSARDWKAEERERRAEEVARIRQKKFLKRRKS